MRLCYKAKPIPALGEIQMRALLLVAAGLVAATPNFATAQIKLQTRADPNVVEVRYFTAIDGLMDGNADVILKETRQGKTVNAASLDLCYPAGKNSDRKDRFVVNLTISGQTLTGSTSSLIDKKPVSVKLTRKQNGDTFDFRGQITIGQTTTEVASSENSDISENEFQDSQTVDDGINATPKDFTEVSPESVGVRIKLDSAAEFLKSLKGADVEVALNSMAITCDALRSGHQSLNLAIDPDRAAALIAKAKSAPGVLAAGWTTGLVEMDRAIRFPAAAFRDGDKVNREKLAQAISDVLSKTLSAKPAGSSWNATTGRLKLIFKRPSSTYPALELTDTIEIDALVSSDRPGGSDQLMLWISSPVTTTSDEGSGPRLGLAEQSGGEEDSESRGDTTGSVEALTRELKGQRWDADKSVWK
jgi:hypothetical protein